MAAREARGHSALWRPTAGRTHAAARRAAVGVAIRAVALELLAATAGTLMTRAESIGTSARLADRELGNRTRGRLLSFDLRQRGADQRPVHRPFFFVAL